MKNHLSTVCLKIIFCLLTLISGYPAARAAAGAPGLISGKVLDTDGNPIDYAMVHVKGTDQSGFTDEKGLYHISVPGGQYTVVYSSAGFAQTERTVSVVAGGRTKCTVKLRSTTALAGITVTGSQLSKVRNSAFNATAISTKDLANTSRTLGDALAKAPGMKLRQSGGVGSDVAVTMDGFSGKHVKVFIDGVPQEGASSALGVNNIPVGFADRIEVYRGVVPVAFGSDAIGGVINIITPKRGRSSYVEASYSYGSFNTHKAAVNFGRTLSNGLKFEFNAFANHSDNDYYVDAPVEDFNTGAINRRKLEHVRRFNDRFHNQTAIARVGVVDKPWADRLMLDLTYTQMYKEIQTGVRQEIVYGQKHRRGHMLMPSLTWAKRNVLAEGLNMNFNANFKRNIVTNVDTANVQYNWHGHTRPLNSPGEQSYMHTRADNDNFTASYTANYNAGEKQALTLSNVLSSFSRTNHNLLSGGSTGAEWDKTTLKNIAGLSYRYVPVRAVNISAFAKHYSQRVAGPVAVSSTQDSWRRSERSVQAMGYGTAATWLMPLGMQLKASYEKALRLPTVDEMFGDEDLENGDMALRPESSHNINLNLSVNRSAGGGTLYAEAALIYRDTHDYIQRNIMALSGGKSAATYINYGRVKTQGLTLTARYSYRRWLSAGAGFTQMNVRDNMRHAQGSSAPNLAYGQRMPNLPYLFADSDINLYWHNLGSDGNVLTLAYDNRFTKSFCYYASNIGSNSSDYMVPDQFEHNVSLSYSMLRGRYTVTAECTNLTDARLYDNFSLQKPGRAYTAKVRVKF